MKAYSKNAKSHSFKTRWIAKFDITRANNIGKVSPCDRHMNYKRCTAAIMNDDNFRSFRMQKPESDKIRKRKFNKLHLKYKPFPDSIMDVVHNISSGLWCPGEQCLKNNFLTNNNIYQEATGLTYCSKKCVGEQMTNLTGDFHKDKIDIILKSITNYFMLETGPPLASLATNFTKDNFRIIAEETTFPKLCNKPKDKRQQIISTGEVVSWNMQGSNSIATVKRFLK